MKIAKFFIVALVAVLMMNCNSQLKIAEPTTNVQITKNMLYGKLKYIYNTSKSHYICSGRIEKTDSYPIFLVIETATEKVLFSSPTPFEDVAWMTDEMIVFVPLRAQVQAGQEHANPPKKYYNLSTGKISEVLPN